MAVRGSRGRPREAAVEIDTFLGRCGHTKDGRVESEDVIPDKPATSRSTSSTTSLPSFVGHLDLLVIKDLALEAHIASHGNPHITCDVITPPFAGAINVAYPLHFSDGVKWVIRFAKEEWNPNLERRMLSVITAMQFIQDRTTMRIPSILGFSLTPDNAIKRPYIFLSYAEGVPLETVWFDPAWMTDEKRAHVFKSITSNMAQLSAFRFTQIGSLESDPLTGQYIVGPLLSEENAPNASSASERGPYNTVHDYLLDGIRRQVDVATSTSELAELALLRMFAASLPEDHLDSGPFVLSYPDFNYQNIYVDDEGSVTAIIDWDGVMVGPMQGGMARFPSWITHDWNPGFHEWRESDGATSSESGRTTPVAELLDGATMEPSPSSLPSAGHMNGKNTQPLRERRREDSPQALEGFRREYLEIYSRIDPQNAPVTARSHIFEALHIAIAMPWVRPGVLNRLCQHVYGDSGERDGPTSATQLSRAIGGGAWLADMEHGRKDRAGLSKPD